MDALPPEVIGEIARHIYQAALGSGRAAASRAVGALSLTSRAFVATARAMMLRVVELDDDARVAALLDLLRARPMLATQIHEIRYRRSSWERGSVGTRSAVGVDELARRVTGVRTLVIDGADEMARAVMRAVGAHALTLTTIKTDAHSDTVRAKIQARDGALATIARHAGTVVNLSIAWSPLPVAFHAAAIALPALRVLVVDVFLDAATVGWLLADAPQLANVSMGTANGLGYVNTRTAAQLTVLRSSNLRFPRTDQAYAPIDFSPFVRLRRLKIVSITGDPLAVDELRTVSSTVISLEILDPSPETIVALNGALAIREPRWLPALETLILTADQDEDGQHEPLRELGETAGARGVQFLVESRSA